MKKFLFGTSALIGAVAFASAAHAEGPTVKVGGFADFQAGFADQDSAFETGANSRDVKFQNDTEIHITVEGKADNGLGYGAVVELEADVTADADGEGGNADKTFLFLESNFGRFELGSNVAPTATMKVDASTIAVATGGIDGDWYDFVNIGGTTGTAFFLVSPNLMLDHGGMTATGAFGDREDSTKISYYTPRFSGFQLGLSYTPDSGNVGTASGFSSDSNAGDFENVFSAGLNYTGQFEEVGVAASATGEFGESEVATREDLAAYALGLNLSFQGFSVGGSWGDWDDSGQVTGANNDANYWNVGAAYETGPFGVSVTYLDSEFAANDFNNLSFGADYQLAPGLVPYVEVNFFDLDQGGTTTDNDGTVVLVGTELTF